jgi:phosphocarrier protein FPr
MVGIVIVSHSAKLAAGVEELARQMTQGGVPLAAAGGIDDPENPIGTDPMAVLEAIQSVYSDDGVVVLMDLGSALLSAEMALEFLEPEQREHVFLSAAPLVEGAMAAAVTASVGGGPQQVIAEAEGALSVKVEQLGGAAAAANAPAAASAGPSDQARRLTLTVQNRLGLHARPAARFVATANGFGASIVLNKDGRAANAKSINQVATLGVRYGDTITLTADGPDAEAALAALQVLADDNFGDPVDSAPSAAADETPPTAAPTVAGALSGIAASPGVAIGPVALYRPRLPEITERPVDDTAAEWQRLRGAIGTALAEIADVARRAKRQVGATEAAIFDAHALVLQDPDLLDAVRARIESAHINAESAWQGEITTLADAYRAMEDDYMRARAADIEDVGQRVLRHLTGLEAPSLDFAQPSVLIAADLTPSDTARLSPERVLGICTELGGATAHSAILARALGIPAVVGLGQALWRTAEGQQVAVDGDQGRLWLDPPAGQLADLAARREAWLAAQTRAKVAGQGEARTRDDLRIEVAANVGGPNDVPLALEYGAEGVGLFRTEFLFMDRDTAPSEEEQYGAYDRAAELMGERPLIIRTLDVGGDKPLPYLDLGEEANPFLGWRGIRFCLDQPAFFKQQLRAILRAGVDANGRRRGVKIMFPMIGVPAEVRAARALLDEARAELAASGKPFDADMEVGIMIEVPSAVVVADQLAREVDFFSIGTNDLTQYVMAADRGNANVARLATALQPAVLRMIRDAAQAAHAAGIWIGMCGELAGNPLATPILVGLGLTELSMSAPSIPAVKEAVRGLSLDEARRVAADALAQDTAEAVSAYLQNRQAAWR